MKKMESHSPPMLSSLGSSMFLSLLILLSNTMDSTTMVVVMAHGDQHTTNDNWYKRYPFYPPYCSTPEEMRTRVIPPLVSTYPDVGDTRLMHATAIIRHGARTPYANDIPCWDGFWESTDTGVWDCELTSFLSPPSPREIREEEESSETSSFPPAAVHGNNSTVSGGGSDAMFLFEKKYDALQKPQHNLLNGTCQLGQLLLRGYDQELFTGKLLREAYAYDGSAKSIPHDIRMRLLDLSDTDQPPYLEPVLRYRADDDERTLLSGQILLRGLFGEQFVRHLETHNGEHPIIPLHTADRVRDILAPSTRECPRLKQLQEAIENDPDGEYQKYLNTDEVVQLQNFMQDVLGNKDVALDCLMTTICTDRTLPTAINDYKHSHERQRQLHNGVHDGDGDDDEFEQGEEEEVQKKPHDYGKNLFQRIADYVSLRVLTHSLSRPQTQPSVSLVANFLLFASSTEHTQVHAGCQTQRFGVFQAEYGTVVGRDSRNDSARDRRG